MSKFVQHIKVKEECAGKPRWLLQENGCQHSTFSAVGAPAKPGTTTRVKGIHGKHRDKIQQWYESGIGPKGCRMRLMDEVSKIVKPAEERELLISKLPSIAKIMSLHKVLNKDGVGEITKGVELMEWAHPKLCLNEKMLKERRDECKFSVRVLRKPLCRVIEVPKVDGIGNPVFGPDGKSLKEKMPMLWYFLHLSCWSLERKSMTVVLHLLFLLMGHTGY
ncbi:MAG: hypothetical protein ACREBR_01795 [bacterium]